MLVALLTILFLGGGTSAFLDYIADSQDAVKTVIPKNEHRKEALNILKSMKKRSKANSRQVRKTIKELGKLLEGREDNGADIAAISERHFLGVESYNGEILDLRFELKEHITREEWAQIFPEK
jgi:hypothetical protein